MIRLFFQFTLILFLTNAAVAAESPGTDPLATLKKVHPRLLASAADFEAMAKTSDPLRAEVNKRILATAEAQMNLPLIDYTIEPGDEHLLHKCNLAFQRITLFSIAYRLSHDIRFANRAKKEMINVSGFSNWTPSHFLNIGVMSMAVAIGYDWCFDTLTPSERTTIKTALMQKALSFGPAAYEPLKPGQKREHNVWFTQSTFNWNPVCNGGLLAAALALADEEPDVARLVIKGARASLPLAMHSYAPDGVWPEGPGYWSFGTTYIVLSQAVLESAIGTDLGLSSEETAFAKTAYFRIQMNSPNRVMFNYADVSLTWEPFYSPALGWIAQRYGPPAAIDDERKALSDHFAKTPVKKEGNAFFPFYALWLPATPDLAATPPPPLDAHFAGLADIAVFRSRWSDPDALYLGFKAGTNGVSHGHQDLGTFIVDADGQRWAAELGPDSYALPQYFGPLRPTYFRLNNLSQSVLIPDRKLQALKAVAPIYSFHSTPNLATAMADLSTVYPGTAQKMLRGVFMLQRSRILVQDDIKSLAPNVTLHWRMMTSASIALSADARTATLTQNSKTLSATIVSPASAKFSIETAAPPTAEENPNTGYAVLQATVPPNVDVTDQRVAVLLTPIGPKWPANLPIPTLTDLLMP